MIETVKVYDMTSGESSSQRGPSGKARLRVCRFVPERKQLRFEWMSQEALKKDETDVHVDEQYTTRMVHFQLSKDVDVRFDIEQDEANITAEVFGIRAFGKCYAFHADGSNISPIAFPTVLRKWALEALRRDNDRESIDYSIFDRNASDENESQAQNARTGMSSDAYVRASISHRYNIQYVWAVIGYTPMITLTDFDPLGFGEGTNQEEANDEEEEDEFHLDLDDGQNSAEDEEDEILSEDSDDDEEDEDYQMEEDEDGEREEGEIVNHQTTSTNQEEEEELFIDEDREPRRNEESDEEDDGAMMNATIYLPDTVNPQTAQQIVGLILRHLRNSPDLLEED